MADKIKQCPYCAEDIKVAAIVCKHCGRELPEYKISAPSKGELTPVVQKPETSNRKQVSVWAVGRKWALWIAILSIFAIPISYINAPAVELVPLVVTGTIANYTLALLLVSGITWITRTISGRWVIAVVAFVAICLYLLDSGFQNENLTEGSILRTEAVAANITRLTQTANAPNPFEQTAEQTAAALSSVEATEMSARLSLPSHCIQARTLNFEELYKSPLDSTLEYCLIGVISDRSNQLTTYDSSPPKYFANAGNYSTTFWLVEVGWRLRISDTTSVSANIVPGQCIVAIGHLVTLPVMELTGTGGGGGNAAQNYFVARSEELAARSLLLDSNGQITPCP